MATGRGQDERLDLLRTWMAIFASPDELRLEADACGLGELACRWDAIRRRIDRGGLERAHGAALTAALDRFDAALEAVFGGGRSVRSVEQLLRIERGQALLRAAGEVLRELPGPR